MTIKKARETIAKAFKDDPDFRRVYVDNVASLLMDRVPGFKRNYEKRNVIADEIIKMLFE